MRIVKTPSTIPFRQYTRQSRRTVMWHTQKQPLPSLQPSLATQLQDSGGQKWTDRIASKHAEKEYTHPLRQFASRIPITQGVCRTRIVAGFGKSQHQSCHQKACTILHENLQGCYQTEDAYLCRYPDSRTKVLQHHVRRNLENNNTHEHELVSKIYGVLVDSNIFSKTAGEG